jgi:cell division protein FtsB
MAIRTGNDARDDQNRTIVPRRRERRLWSQAALFAACVVLANGVFGERGLADGLRARRAYAAAAEQLARLREENAALRDRARALQNDPSAIETVARGEFGLVRPGEILVTVRDVK